MHAHTQFWATNVTSNSSKHPTGSGTEKLQDDHHVYVLGMLNTDDNTQSITFNNGVSDGMGTLGIASGDSISFTHPIKCLDFTASSSNLFVIWRYDR
jgi:hypothetical protein